MSTSLNFSFSLVLFRGRLIPFVDLSYGLAPMMIADMVQWLGRSFAFLSLKVVLVLGISYFGTKLQWLNKHWGIAKKHDNLWVKWVHSVYVKDKDSVQFTAPKAAS